MNKENMKGNVLVFVLIVLTLVLILGTGVIAKSLVSQQHSLKQVSDQQAYYIAKSVLDGMKEHFTNPSTASSAVALLPTGTKEVTSLVEIADKQGRKWNCKVIIENDKVKESKLAADEVRITATAMAKDNAANSKETISMILKQKQETSVGERIGAPRIEIKGNKRATFKYDSIYAERRIEISGNRRINTWQLKNLVAGEEIQIKTNRCDIFTENLYCGIQDSEVQTKLIAIEGNFGVITIAGGIFYKDTPQINIDEKVNPPTRKKVWVYLYRRLRHLW